MKNSGIEWIGEIPDSWRVGKLKYYIDCLDGKRIPVDSSLRKEGIYPYWGAGSIQGYINDYIFDEELILLGEDGAPFFDYTRNVAFLVNEKIWVNNHIHVLRAKKQIKSKFLMYYLNVVHYKYYINGSILNKLTQGNMNSIALAVSSITEQQKISDFLDEKCGKIDKLIENEQKQIEKMKEYKQSVITSAVTKGLDSTAPMKDSGIDWIGEIPESWSRVATKKLFDIYAGATPKSDHSEYWDGDIKWITPADYKTEDKFVSYGRKNLTEKGLKSCSTILVPQRSLIFSKRAPIGSVAINTEVLCTNQGCLSCVNKKKLNITYYYYLISIATVQYELLGTGTTFKEISAEKFSNFALLYPSVEEQTRIANYLDEKCGKIDEVISIKQSKIEKLQEYKKSLIYEYVTGKKEVV